MFEDSEQRTLLDKIAALYALQSNVAIAGIDVAADDAMMQLKATRLILEMKRAYEEQVDESVVGENRGDFAESDEQSRDFSLRSIFLDAKTSELLMEMKNVEEKIANNVDEGFNYLFQTSEDATVEDKASSLRALLDNIIEEGVDVLATDGLLQVQSSICVLEMLQIYTSMAAADDLETSKGIENFIEEEEWISAQDLIKDPASFSEAVDLLPAPISDKLKNDLAEGGTYEVEKQLGNMRKKIEERLMDLSAEDNRDEVEFSYNMLDLLDFIKREAPKNTMKQPLGSN